MTTTDRSFTIAGSRTGFLLVHGLGGTPLELRMTAKGIASAGFTVHCCQLAGHCGTEEELLATTWQDWYESVDAGLARLESQCDTVIVGGLSIGAILALRLAALQPERVHGVACFAPTLWYDGWAMPKTQFLLRRLWFLPIVKRCRFAEREPFGVKDERMRAFVVKSLSSGDSTSAGHSGTHARSLHQFWQLADDVKARLPQIKQPVFIAHPREDDLASLKNAFFLQQHLGGLVEMLVLDDSYHIITIDRQWKVLADRTIRFAQGIEQHRPRSSPAMDEPRAIAAE
jgi:carboxylesterase